MIIGYYDKESLLVKPYNIYKIIFFVVLSLSFLVFGAIYILKEEKEKIYISAEKQITIKNSQEFSKENFISEVKKYGFKYEKYVIAQAILESGNFTSLVFKKNNNAFGLREAKTRVTTSHGTQLNYSYYPSYIYSIADRALYEARYLSNLTEEQYLKALDEVYAEGHGYSQKLKQIVKQHKL